MSLDQLVGGPDRRGRPSMCRGRVVREPASDSDPMFVVLLGYTSSYEYEIPASHWAPHGEILPSVGDRCLVKFDDVGDGWVGSDWGAPA